MILQKLIMSSTSQNTMVFGSCGKGKTSAAVIKFMNAIKIEEKSLQCLFICINYESAFQAYDLSKKLSNGAMNLELIQRIADDSHSNDTQILFGAAHDILAKIESRNINVGNIDLICFDDCERTMTSEKIKNHILQKLNETAMVMMVTSRHPNNASAQLVKTKLAGIRGATVQQCSVQNESYQMLKNIAQYAVEVSSENRSKLNVITDVCDLIIRNPKCKVILFCKDKTEVKELYSEMVKKYDSNVLSFCGQESYEVRTATIEKMNEDDCQIIVANQHIANGINISSAAICIISQVPYKSDLHTPNISSYSNMASRVGRFGKKSIAIALISQHETQEFKNAFRFCTVCYLKHFK